jgi:hypothetical protein
MVPELCALRFFTIGQMHVTVFRGFFSTPYHIGTWNFPWGSSELSYTWSSRFIIVTPMVPELCALRFFTIGHMHVKVFRVFFLHRIISSELSYTSSSHFIIVIHMVPELPALGFFFHRTYACNSFLSPKAGPLVMASITPASSFHFCFNF